MTELNIPLLQKTLDWAYVEWQKATRGEISEWNQGDWMLPITDVHGYYQGDVEEVAAAVQAGTVCGTACCLAGKVAYDDGWRMVGGGGATVRRGGEISDIRSIAVELLGLTEDQATRLFAGFNNIFDLFRIASEITDEAVTAPTELMLQDPRNWL